MQFFPHSNYYLVFLFRYFKDETTETPRRTNNLRARRPNRPLITTTSVAPETTTAALPPGTKYLIRTRRPINGQTKLKTGRSRIRRPTLPTTPITTTISTTTTENPFANFNVQLNQQQQYYDSLQVRSAVDIAKSQGLPL